MLDRANLLVGVALALSAMAFAVFGYLLEIHLLYFDRTGYALSALFVSAGFGLIVSRALVDPRPRPGAGADARLQQRALGLAVSVVFCGAVIASHQQSGSPDVDLASVVYGLCLGSAVVFGTLLLRWVRPPLPAPPIEETIEALHAEGAEAVVAEMLGEPIPDDPGGEEEAASPGRQGGSGPNAAEMERRKQESQRRRKEGRSTHKQRRGVQSRVDPARQPGRQQRGRG